VGYFGLDRSAFVVSAAVFMAASAVGSYAGYKGYVYAWIAPEFCYLCHIHDYAVEDWRRSIHGDVVTCHDCHRVPLMHYTQTALHTVYDRPTYPEDLEELPHISSETCESCHVTGGAEFEELSSPMPRTIFDATAKVELSPGHMWHMESADRDPGEDHGGTGAWDLRDHALPEHGAKAHDLGFGTGAIQCIDCHGTEANRFHNFTARAENCHACHTDLTVRGEHLSDFDCRHCHFREFLAPGDATAVSQPALQLPIKDPMIP
jgi:hypothetical protein